MMSVVIAFPIGTTNLDKLSNPFSLISKNCFSKNSIYLHELHKYKWLHTTRVHQKYQITHSATS